MNKLSLTEILAIIDVAIAEQKARQQNTDAHPIASALDRAHAMGGEIALVALKVKMIDAATEGKRA